MTIRDTLTQLRKLFSDKRNWTQGTYFRMPTRYAKRDRTCYCLAGGLNKVTGRNLLKDLPQNEIKALGFESSNDLFDWNDHPQRTVQEVRIRIDQAIVNIGKKKKVWTV